MRIRSVKPELYTDDLLGPLPADVSLFYVGLWNFADDDGRFRWDPLLMRAALDPYDAKFKGPKGIVKLLDQLERLGCLRKYEVAGKPFGLVIAFRKHQVISKPTPSKLPAPPVFLPEPSGSPPVALLPGREGKGREQGEEQGKDSGEVNSPPPVAVMPCVGEGPEEFAVTEAMVAEWATSYPGVDVRREVLRAAQWAKDNPQRRKTHRGAPGFFSRWLAKTQDAGRPGPLPPKPAVTAPASNPDAFREGGRRAL